MKLFRIITSLIGSILVSQSSGDYYKIDLGQNYKSSSSSSEHPVAMVTDFNLDTFVQVDYTLPGCWLQFDLLGIYMVNGITIWPTNDEDYKMARVLIYLRLNDSIDYSYSDVASSYSNPQLGIPFTTGDPNQKTRYVLLRKDLNFGLEMIKIAEIAIYTGQEEFLVPTDGLLSQSHFYEYYQYKSSSKAVDKNINTCIHTAQEYESQRYLKGWWRIDMRRPYYVNAINLNDLNGEDPYRTNYIISVGLKDYFNVQLCGYFNSSSANQNYRFLCNSRIQGRYLTVERNDTKRADVVNFCEIEIIALHYAMTSSYYTTWYAVRTTTPSWNSSTSQSTTTTAEQDYVSISLNKDESSQNHDFNDWSNTLQPSKFALDNDVNTCSLTAQEDVSLRSSTKAWWRLDLEKTYLVNSIKILPGNVSKYIDSASAWPFSVYVDKEYYATVQICAEFNGYIKNYANYITLECRRELQGRYVSILGTTDTLALCEVAVLAANVTLEKNQGLTFCTRDEIIIGCVVGSCCLILGALLGWIITYKK